MSALEIAQLLMQIGTAVGLEVWKAVQSGQSITSVLDKPLRDLLPAELRTTIAKREADLAAAAKFGA